MCMMKKYLLGVCFALSIQANAYDGATIDFTTDFFSQTVAEGILTAFASNDVDKRACVLEQLTPIMNNVAKRYIGQSLTKEEMLLMDDFLDTPLGQALYHELHFGGIREFGSSFDDSQYYQAEYVKYLDVIHKFFNGIGENTPELLGGEVKDEILNSAVECRMQIISE